MQNYANLRTGSLQTRLNLVIYYAQRLVTSSLLRSCMRRILILFLKARYPNHKKADAGKLEILDDFNKNGFARLGSLLTEDMCNNIRCYLSLKLMSDVRETHKIFCILDVPPQVKLGDFPLDTVINAPHVMEFANHPKLIALASAYLGFKPIITNISLRWSFPTRTTARDIQDFHRDCEPASIKVFVYLTDVDINSGPHVYVCGTHTDARKLRLRTYSNAEIDANYETQVTVVGDAGTTFVIDSHGIHKGLAPSKRARLMLGIQYSLLPCLAYENNSAIYKGNSRLDPYINQMMVQNINSTLLMS